MDKSDFYVEMCTAAVEIQTIYEKVDKEWEKNNRGGSGLTRYVFATRYQTHTNYEDNGTRTLIWLPAQDQLQEIMADKEKIKLMNNSAVVQLNRVKAVMHEYGVALIDACNKGVENFWMPKTFEQWWLITVMQWAFKKNWDYITKTWQPIKVA